MQEEWKTMKNYKNYSCSNLGRVRNDHTSRILNPKINNTEYITLTLENDNGKKIHTGIHRLIAETWIENTDNKPTVNHKNKIRTDNRVENLEWATHSEQNTHKSVDQKKEINSNIGIWKCDKNTGIRITYYRTIQEAADYHDIKSTGNIVSCAKGRISYAYGFKWEYDDGKIINIAIDSYENEKWELINNNYYISNFGRLISDNRLLTPTQHDGYYIYNINDKQYRAHRLVAMKFIQNPNKFKIVNHLNGNKLDNKYTNLEWCTQKRNSQHAIDNGFNKNIRKVINYDDNYNIIEVYQSCSDAGRKLSIDQSAINQCCNGKANIYDKNKVKLNFKFLEPTDDLVNRKIDTSNLIVKQKKIRGDSKKRKINVYDKKMNLIDTCNSRVETSKKYKVHRNTITAHCNGISKYITSNYNFKYAD